MNIYIKTILVSTAATLAGFFYLKMLAQKKKPAKEFNVSVLLKAQGKDGYKVSGKEVKGEVFDKLTEKASSLSDDYSVSFTNDDKIKIELKNVADSSDIAGYFTNPNILEIWELYNLGEIAAGFKAADNLIKLQSGGSQKNEPIQLKPSDSNVLSKVIEANPVATDDKNGLHKYIYQEYANDFNSAFLGFILPEDSTPIFTMLKQPEVIAVLPQDVKFVLGTYEPYNKKNFRALYAVKTYNQPDRPFLTDRDIKQAMQDFNPETGKPNITFEFKKEGAVIWEQLTRRNINRGIAMMVDGVVKSAPTISGVIEGGKVEIAGSFTVREAMAIATSLNTGRMPIPLSLISYKISKTQEPVMTQKIFLLLMICLLLSGGISYILFSRFKPVVNK